MARERPALRASSQAVRIILQPVRTSVLVAVLLALQLGLLQHSAHAIDFTLASQDGYFYPALDDLLASPTTGTVLGTLSELESLADPATGVVKISSGRKAVIASSFFSIFSTVKFPLWRVETLANGSSTNVIPAGFAVSPDAELLLVGFSMNWMATPKRNMSASSAVTTQFPALQPLLERLRMYVELSSGARLQLLRSRIEAINCDALLRLYNGLGLLRMQYEALPALSGGIRPEMRMVYPYLFIKYAQLGPFWVEQPPTLLNVSSVDDFLGALRLVEAADLPACTQHQTVLRLTRNITLDVARWPQDGAYITSNVTIEAASDTGGPVILDFSGGLNLFKLRAAAFVQLRGIVLANLALSPVGAYVVPIWPFQFDRELKFTEESRLHLVNTTGIIPSDEFVHLQYWTTILTNPTAAIAALAAWQKLVQRMELLAMAPDSLTFAKLCAMGVTGDNIVITTRTFGVRQLVPVTGVNQLLGTDFRVGPPYMVAVYNANMLANFAKLAEQDGLTNGNTTTVLLLLQNDVTLMDPAKWPPPGALQVRRKIIIQGKPFKNVTLDFGGGTSLFTTTGLGAVNFRQLTVRRAGWLLPYNRSTAASEKHANVFMQASVWPVLFDRNGVAKVDLTNATLMVSPQEVQIYSACLAYHNATRLVAGGGSSSNAVSAVVPSLPGSLTPEMCSEVFPRDTLVTNASSSALAISVMTITSFHADNITVLVDVNVTRPDLDALLAGRLGRGCFVMTRMRARSRQHEKHLRGLQAKQAHHLEELSKTNPLAQLILDHLAGKDPGVAQLVVTNTGPSHDAAASAVAAGAADTHCTGSGSTGALAPAASASGRHGSATTGGANSAANLGIARLSGFAGFTAAMAARLQRRTSLSGLRHNRSTTERERSSDAISQSPVLEELLRLSVDLAGEIDDNQLIVTDVVASGGFGTVYKGMWHNLAVAVKIVLFSTASVNRRIALQEAALSKSISHPNIIATYAVDAKPMSVLGRVLNQPQANGGSLAPGGQPSKSLADIQEWRLYIIQEFADGGTLRRALDRGVFHDPHTGLPRMDALLDIAQGVAAALAHLHSKNVVHGDLNPKNVLLKIAPLPMGGLGFSASAARSSVSGSAPGTGGSKASWGGVKGLQPGSGGATGSGLMLPPGSSQFGSYPMAGRCGFAIKVADFGLSVKMENSHISGLRQGTPFYAAPELTTLGIFSRAADTYAYGVMLWELFWGRPIWVPDARAPGGYVQHADFPHLPRECPPEYAQLLADCLQLNHLQRPCFEEVLVRLRLMAQGLAMAAVFMPNSGAYGPLDSAASLTMPGLPVAGWGTEQKRC
eukprot:XP_001702735.1 serine/threonine protein kinase [Chlamydomonas reinhardtii]